MSRRLPPRTFVPNSVTAANIAFGFSAMLVAARERYELAVYLLLTAIFLDMFDGRLARRLNATSEFGQQMDSFSDAVSFGCAPAFLVFQAVLQPLRGVGVAVALAYLLAGVFRLARFNLTADAHEKSARTTGVPIPLGAGYIMAAVLMRDHMPPWVVAALVVFLAWAMASRWSLPDLKGRSVVSAMLVVGAFNYLAVVIWPNWGTVIWWNVWNGAILFAARGGSESPEPRDLPA